MELSVEEEWVLSITCVVHNQLTSEYLKRHSFIDRLFEENERLIVEISKSLIRPRDILHILKQRKKQNCEYYDNSLQRKIEI